MLGNISSSLLEIQQNLSSRGITGQVIGATHHVADVETTEVVQCTIHWPHSLKRVATQKLLLFPPRLDV